MKKQSVIKRVATCAVALALTVVMLPNSQTTVYAQSSGEKISADVYELEEDSNYQFTSADKGTAAAVGTLTVNGERYTAGKDGNITDFAINRDYVEQDMDYNLSLSYSYDDSLLSAADDQWHLVSDGDKKVDYIALDGKIGKGALIVQTSKDRTVWVTAYSATNIFEENQNGVSDFYKTTDVQLANGCYYRVIVAYEVTKKTASSKILLWNKDNYESKKCVEVYQFHAYDTTAQNTEIGDVSPKYNLGSRVRTAEYDGYFGEKVMEKGDPHYGWDLGQFFVSGYTDTSLDRDGNVIFLKNTGDQVSLWFNLQQNLDCLNGNSKITIEPDTAGYDKYFETPTTDFGYGALIIRKVNNENTREKTQIYTDYLLASATVGADTKVSLFEEGDYEVALDYAVKNDKTVVFGKSILSGESHYRIYFKFSVRNSNSMFFIRDLKTGSVLANNAIAPNGFYLDLAGSKYLHLNYKREVLSQGADGLSEDVRENKAAKDGESFTKEGIYTVTVTNTSTNTSVNKDTTKRIYVGDDEILKAYMTTGLSIGEIRDRVANGSTIDDFGNIIDPVVVEITSEATTEEENDSEEATTEEISSKETSDGGVTEEAQEAETVESTAESDDKEAEVQTKDNADEGKSSPVLLTAVCAVILVIGGFFIGIKLNKKGSQNTDRKE